MSMHAQLLAKVSKQPSLRNETLLPQQNMLMSSCSLVFVLLSFGIMSPLAQAFVVGGRTPDLRKRAVSVPPKSLPNLLTWQNSNNVCVSPFCKECPPSTLICSVIGDASSSPLSDDSSSAGSDLDLSSVESTTAAAATLQQPMTTPTWREKLLKASNFASMLCVLDCTILPLVTVVLPLFGVVAASPAQMEYLHELGHQVALFFVMPVGGLATTMNYTNHRKKWIAALGCLGLLAVLVANAGCHWAHDLAGPVGHFLDRWLHVLHHGVMHRVTNLTGCALLLFSNFMSRRQGGCKDPTCTHKH